VSWWLDIGFQGTQILQRKFSQVDESAFYENMVNQKKKQLWLGHRSLLLLTSATSSVYKEEKQRSKHTFPRHRCTRPRKIRRDEFALEYSFFKKFFFLQWIMHHLSNRQGSRNQKDARGKP
jgi:hypothetical protein